MANRETYTFTITKLYLQKPLHENKSTCVAFTCNECNCKTVWEVRRSITVQANHQARDGRETYSFGQNGFYKTFHLFHFQFIKCFKRLNFIAWFFLFIFLEKSKFKLHYVSQCNFPSPPPLIKPNKTLLHSTPVMSLAQQAQSVTQSSFKDGGVSRRCCHRWRNKRSLCG